MNNLIQKAKEKQGELKRNRTIEVSKKVTVRENVEGENPRSTVDLNIPFSLHLCGIRPLAEYKRIALEDIRIKIGTLFSLVKFLGEEVRAGSYGEQGLMNVTEFNLLAALLGKGLSEALEAVEDSFDRFQETPAAPEVENKAAAPKYSDKQMQSLEETAAQLETAMRSDDTPQGVKDCLYTIIFEASNEANMPLGDVGLVRAAFPRIIEALPIQYGRAIYFSVQEILRLNTTVRDGIQPEKSDGKESETKETFDFTENLDSEDLAEVLSGIINNPNLPAEFYKGMRKLICDLGNELSHDKNRELFDYETSPEYIEKLFHLSRPDGSDEETEKPVFDLPKSSIEDLAQKLSDIMHNPNLPEKVYRCLADELNTNHIDFYSAENILGNLKEMKEKK